MRFIIADTHFGHKNIIRLCNRPFSDKHDMEVKLIDNWNGMVGANDEVYVLGDFALVPTVEDLEDITQQLNGKKFLVRGNHDHFSKEQYMRAGFSDVLFFGELS